MSLSAKPPGSTLVLASSTLALPSTTNRVESSSRFRRVFPFPWPARLPLLLAPTWHGAAAHTPLHSPIAGAVRRPASGPPLPPLSSSHSSRHARRAATHTVVSPCPVRTAPKYSARFLPAVGAPGLLSEPSQQAGIAKSTGVRWCTRKWAS